MTYLIVGTVYLASVLITRQYYMREFPPCGQDSEALWLCVIPLVNTVAALVITFCFVYIALDRIMRADKVVRWFFNKK